jgi:hypothetical protein
MNIIFKKLVLVTVTVMVCSLYSNAQVIAQKVGTNPTIINSSAVFEVESTTKGFLPPWRKKTLCSTLYFKNSR